MAKVKVIAKWLTTADNPFDYITQHDDWLRWDQDAGYKTPGLIARLAVVSDSATSELDAIEAINEAVDRILSVDPTGNYKLITQELEVDDDR